MSPAAASQDDVLAEAIAALVFREACHEDFHEPIAALHPAPVAALHPAPAVPDEGIRIS